MERIRRQLVRAHPETYDMPQWAVLTTSEGTSEAETQSALPNAAPFTRNHAPPGIPVKDWTLQGLVEQGACFKLVPRVSALSEHEMLEAIRKYEAEGEPLIIEHWDKHPKWPKHIFDLE